MTKERGKGSRHMSRVSNCGRLRWGMQRERSIDCEIVGVSIYHFIIFSDLTYSYPKSSLMTYRCQKIGNNSNPIRTEPEKSKKIQLLSPKYSSSKSNTRIKCRFKMPIFCMIKFQIILQVQNAHLECRQSDYQCPRNLKRKKS